MRMTDLRVGWAILGNDGRRVGSIREVGQNYILTSRPGMAADLFVPVSYVGNVGNETVYLTIPQADAGQMGWEQGPLHDDTLDASPESDLHRHV